MIPMINKYQVIILIFATIFFAQNPIPLSGNNNSFKDNITFNQAISFTATNGIGHGTNSILSNYLKYNLSPKTRLHSSLHFINSVSNLPSNNNLNLKYDVGLEHKFSENTVFRIYLSNYTSSPYFNLYPKF